MSLNRFGFPTLAILAAVGGALCFGPYPARAETTTIQGGRIEKIKIAAKGKGQTVSSVDWVALRAGRTQITVDKDTLVTARLSAQSGCGGPASDLGEHCLLKITATEVASGKTIEFRPGPLVLASVDATDAESGIARLAKHSVDRSVVLKKRGTYRITTSVATSRPTVRFPIASLSLILETAKFKD